jgi:hypothetical protein
MRRVRPQLQGPQASRATAAAGRRLSPATGSACPSAGRGVRRTHRQASPDGGDLPPSSPGPSSASPSSTTSDSTPQGLLSSGPGPRQRSSTLGPATTRRTPLTPDPPRPRRPRPPLTGQTGVGKSYLACALGQKACREGYAVVYRRAALAPRHRRRDHRRRRVRPPCSQRTQGEAGRRVDQEDEGGLDQDPEAGEVDLPSGVTSGVIALPDRVIGIGRNGRSAWPESAPTKSTTRST